MGNLGLVLMIGADDAQHVGSELNWVSAQPLPSLRSWRMHRIQTLTELSLANWTYRGAGEKSPRSAGASRAFCGERLEGDAKGTATSRAHAIVPFFEPKTEV